MCNGLTTFRVQVYSLKFEIKLTFTGDKHKLSCWMPLRGHHSNLPCHQSYRSCIRGRVRAGTRRRVGRAASPWSSPWCRMEEEEVPGDHSRHSTQLTFRVTTLTGSLKAHLTPRTLGQSVTFLPSLDRPRYLVEHYTRPFWFYVFTNEYYPVFYLQLSALTRQLTM